MISWFTTFQEPIIARIVWLFISMPPYVWHIFPVGSSRKAHVSDSYRFKHLLLHMKGNLRRWELLQILILSKKNAIKGKLILRNIISPRADVITDPLQDSLMNELCVNFAHHLPSSAEFRVSRKRLKQIFRVFKSCWKTADSEPAVVTFKAKNINDSPFQR